MKHIIASLALALLSFPMLNADENPQRNPVGATFMQKKYEMPRGTYLMSCNGYEIYTIAVSDKVNFSQPASLFYGENDSDRLKVDTVAPSGEIPSSMNCFLVKADGDYILFDAGLSPSKGGMTIQRLTALNLSPTEIKAVFLTHSHSDHIGGLFDESGKAAFPEAIIYISKDEFDYMKGFKAEEIRKIEEAYPDRVKVFGFGEILSHNILPISAKGHTPGHTAFRLGNILFAGDIMHGASIQLLYPEINANYDADRHKAAETRARLLDYAVSNSLTVFGAHIPLNGVLF